METCFPSPTTESGCPVPADPLATLMGPTHTPAQQHQPPTIALTPYHTNWQLITSTNISTHVRTNIDSLRSQHEGAFSAAHHLRQQLQGTTHLQTAGR
jgi:hypothetical protein